MYHYKSRTGNSISKAINLASIMGIKYTGKKMSSLRFPRSINLRDGPKQMLYSNYYHGNYKGC